MIKQRSFVLTVVFMIITFGIYGLYWIYRLAKDTNLMCAGDGKKTTGLFLFMVLSFITAGIYSWVWYFMLGDRLQENAPRYGLNFKEGGGAILLWALLGSLIIVGPFISIYIITKNMNALAEAFNKKGQVQA